MVQIVPHQAMGYDRAITVFSPDGRLLQVEYAKKAVSQGAMALGIKCTDGVVLMADRRLTDPLMVPESSRKIFKLDEHIEVAASGLISDARVLVKRCRVYAQQHRLTYGERADAESIVKYISDMAQTYTQYGGIRPFGISFLLGGIDRKGIHLYKTEPSGIYFEFKAKAIGIGSADANKILEAKYKSNMNTEAGLKLALDAFKKVLGKDFEMARLETATIKKNGVKEVREAELKTRAKT